MNKKLLATIAWLSFALPAVASTFSETVKSDGSISFSHEIIDVVLGQNKGAISTALLLLGTLLCVASVWLGNQKRSQTQSKAAELSVSSRSRFNIKGVFTFEALVLVFGVFLAVSGAIIAVTERFYTATI